MKIGHEQLEARARKHQYENIESISVSTYTYPEEQMLTVLRGGLNFFEDPIDFYIKCLMLEDGYGFEGFMWVADSYFKEYYVVLESFPDEQALGWLSMSGVPYERKVMFDLDDYQAAWVRYLDSQHWHILFKLKTQYVAMFWCCTA